MHYGRQPIKLQDCKTHGSGSGAELFIVEGDSASQAVATIRDVRFQAVLPMQGKPINAAKTSRERVLKFELFAQLCRALGYEPERIEADEPIDPDVCRFERIVLLFDPDADGIHCEALALLFFFQILKPLITAGRIHSVQAPMFQFQLEHETQSGLPPRYAFSEEHARRLFAQLESLGIQVKRLRYRGLAGMHAEALLETCVSPESRRLRQLHLHDAEAAMSVFGCRGFTSK